MYLFGLYLEKHHTLGLSILFNTFNAGNFGRQRRTIRVRGLRLYGKYLLFQYSRANIVELSTFIGAFEDYLENNAAKDLSVLPPDIQLLLESPLSLNYVVTMGCTSPYDDESDEFELLLQWLEYSASLEHRLFLDQ